MAVKIQKSESKKAPKKTAKAAKEAAKTPAEAAGKTVAAAGQGIATEFARLRDEIDQRFERMVEGWPDWPRSPGRFFETAPFKDLWGPITLPRHGLMPSVDFGETEKAYEISAELPGMDEKDVEVLLTDGGITIKGEKKSEREEKEKDYHRVERSFGSFRRYFALPDEIDADHIDAKFKNGVLKVVLPKSAKAKAKSRKIDVKRA